MEDQPSIKPICIVAIVAAVLGVGVLVLSVI
nr:MAG TPA: hypothetical protein [Caudoviricetes sp.]